MKDKNKLKEKHFSTITMEVGFARKKDFKYFVSNIKTLAAPGNNILIHTFIY